MGKDFLKIILICAGLLCTSNAYAGPWDVEQSRLQSEGAVAEIHEVQLAGESRQVLVVHIVEQSSVRETSQVISDRFLALGESALHASMLVVVVHPRAERNIPSFEYWLEETGQRLNRGVESARGPARVTDYLEEMNQSGREVHPEVQSLLEQVYSSIEDRENVAIFLQALDAEGAELMPQENQTGLIMSAAVRGGFSASGVALAMSVGGVPIEAAFPPTLIAGAGSTLVGLLNPQIIQMLNTNGWLHLPQNLNLSENQRQRLEWLMREAESYSEQVLISLAFLTLFRATSYLSGASPEAVTLPMFVTGVVMATATSFAKSAVIVRALARLTQMQQMQSPRQAYRFQRLNNWLLALIGGGLVTFSDALWAIEHPLAWPSMIALVGGGVATYVAGEKALRLVSTGKELCQKMTASLARLGKKTADSP